MIINKPTSVNEINRLRIENNCLRMQIAYLQVENEKLQEKINNFNKALEMMGGVK